MYRTHEMIVVQLFSCQSLAQYVQANSSAHPLPKKISKYFPKRLELLFFTVLAFPKDSRTGLASKIYACDRPQYSHCCMHAWCVCVCVCALLHEATTSLHMCHDCMCVGPTCSDVMLEPSVLTAAKYCMANLVASVLPAPLSPLYSKPVECEGS